MATSKKEYEIVPRHHQGLLQHTYLTMFWQDSQSTSNISDILDFNSPHCFYVEWAGRALNIS